MLETTTRFLSPREIVKQFDLEIGMKIADFGSGAGDFSIAIAQYIQPTGKVFAIDVMESAHQSLRSKYKIQGITNIELILTNLETDSGSTLPKESVDRVMIHNILFQVNDKKHLLKEAHKILKEKGKLVIIEWDITSPIGPLKSSRIPERELVSLIQNNGFEIDHKIDAGKYHYGYIFKKS